MPEEKKIQLGQTKQQEISAAQELQAQGLPEGEFLDTEFIVPTDDVMLPSQGKFYANGQKSVKIKYLTAEDENILTSPELIRNGRVLDVLLENSIIDSSLSPTEMLTGDRNATLLALRTTGYGDEYEVKKQCESCSETFTEQVLLSELKIKELKVTPDGNNEFEVILPKMKIPIKFRLLTGADENRLAKVSEMGKKKINNKVSVSTLLTERFLLQIMEAKSQRDKGYIKKMISAMPIADSLFLREYIREIEPGVDMSYTFTCTSCGKIQIDDVPVTAKLFWPNANV